MFCEEKTCQKSPRPSGQPHRLQILCSRIRVKHQDLQMFDLILKKSGYFQFCADAKLTEYKVQDSEVVKILTEVTVARREAEIVSIPTFTLSETTTHSY